jgi:hypothetical protein
VDERKTATTVGATAPRRPVGQAVVAQTRTSVADVSVALASTGNALAGKTMSDQTAMARTVTTAVTAPAAKVASGAGAVVASTAAAIKDNARTIAAAKRSVLNLAKGAVLPAAALLAGVGGRQVAGLPMPVSEAIPTAVPVARKAPAPSVAPEETLAPASKIISLRGPRHSLLRRIVGLIVVTVSLGSAALWQVQSQGADQVTEEEEMSRQVAFAELRDVQLQSIPKAEAALAFAQMQLEQDDRNALGDLLAESARASSTTPLVGSTGSVRLARMILRDTHSPDGDVIAVMSAGFRQEVTLTSLPQALVVPVDDTLIVQVVGIRDGSGGGITLGVRGTGEEVLMPLMRQGQILSLPIAR